MKSKILSLMFAVALAVSCIAAVSVTASAGQLAPAFEVSDIDELQAALNAAADGDTVLLSNDITATHGVVFNPSTAISVTLDLGGYTLKVTNDTVAGHRAVKVAAGTLTVKNGTIDARNVGQEGTPTPVNPQVAKPAAAAYQYGMYGAVRVDNEGSKVVLDGVTLYNNHCWGLAVKANDNTHAVIQNCTFHSVVGGGIEAAGSTVTVDGCTFDQTGKSYAFGYISCAIAVSSESAEGSVTVKNTRMTLVNATYALYCYDSGGTVTIEGGNFSVAGEGTEVIHADAKNAAKVESEEYTTTNPSVVNIQGGTFTGNVRTTATVNFDDGEINGDVEVRANGVLNVKDGSVNGAAKTFGTSAKINQLGGSLVEDKGEGVYSVGKYLDLESTTAYPDSKSFEQKYTLEQNGDTVYVDVTKVKVEWTVTDITATYSGSKTWDPDTLSWKELDKSNYNVSAGTASFKITNLSSVKVQAEISFEAASEDFNPDVEILLGEDETSETVIDSAVDETDRETVAAAAPSVTFTVTVTPGDTDFTELADTTSATAYGTYTVTIEEYEEAPACIASGTMVTLANGTKKVIDDVTVSDVLLTYNFFTGEIQGNKPIYILTNDNILSSVITLSFSDGSKLEICDEQSFFDMDARDYFLISRKNYRNAVGKNVMQIKDGAIKTVKITDVSLVKRYCTSYELATENAINFVANGIVNTPPDYFLPGTYTVGEDMKVDAERYQADVTEYGLYTYADFANYITENTFITGHIADVKIAVGKGLISEENVFACYEEWTPVIHDANK